MKDKALNQEYIEKLRQAWKKRAIQKQEDMDKLRREAFLKANAAACHLKNKYNVNAVFLYGSLVWSEKFSQRSDIDLFIEGFSKKHNYWRMLVELGDITKPIEINVVLSENATPGLREKARNEGCQL